MHKCATYYSVVLCLLLGATASLRAGDELPSKVLKPSGGVESISLGADGRWLVTGCKEDTRLWDLKADDPSAKSIVVRGSAGPVSPDDRWLMTAGNDRTIRLWDLKADDPSAEGREVARYEADWEPVRGVAISPNNRWLVTVGADKVLRLWDLKVKGEVGRPQVLLKRQGGFVFRSPDGRWLTTGSSAGNVGVWDFAADDPVSKALVRQLKKDKGYAGPQGISPDGRWLVTGGRDQTARRWDMRTIEDSPKSEVLRGHTNWVEFLAVSLNSRWLVTAASTANGDFEGAARLWDLEAADPTAVRAVLGHGGSLQDAIFCPDNRWLVSRASDKTVRLWDLKATKR